MVIENVFGIVSDYIVASNCHKPDENKPWIKAEMAKQILLMERIEIKDAANNRFSAFKN